MKVTDQEKQFIVDNYDKLRIKEIAVLLNTGEQRVRNIAYSLNLKSPFKYSIRSNTLNDIPEQFVVLDTVKTKYGRFNIKVKCPYCINTFVTSPHKLRSGHTKSCGCSSFGHRKGGENISGSFMQRLIQHAKARHLSIDVDIDFLEKLYLKQDKRCALSGLEITLGYADLIQVTASLDRIDSTKGYTKDNVQFVHKDINWMKQDFEQDQFLEYCFAIYRNNHAKP